MKFSQTKSFLLCLFFGSTSAAFSGEDTTDMTDDQLPMSCTVLRYGTEIYDEFTKLEFAPLQDNNRQLTAEYYSTVEQHINCKKTGDKLTCTWNKWLGLGFYRYNMTINMGKKFVYEGPNEDLFQYSVKGELEAWFIRPADVLCHVWHPDVKD